MPRSVAAFLILVLALSSIGLGAARGTVRVGDEIVLCTGHGIVVARLPGETGLAARYCPDMALTLLAALDLPATDLWPQTSCTQLLPDAAQQGRIHPAAQGRHARAPPARLGPDIT